MKKLAFILSSVALVACGGGGGPSEPSAPQDPPVQQPSLPAIADRTLVYDNMLALFREQGEMLWEHGSGAADINLTDGDYSDIVLFRNHRQGYEQGAVTSFLFNYDPEIASYQMEEINLEGDARQTIVADFTGDGREDLFLATHGIEFGDPNRPDMEGGRNRLWLQDENGVLSDAMVTTQEDYTHSACAIDINADGKLDLFENNAYHHAPEVLINLGGGVFEPDASLLPEFVSGMNSLRCLVADFDNDGRDDLILGIPGQPYYSEAPVQDMWKSNIILFGDGARLTFDPARSVIRITDFPFATEYDTGNSIYMATLELDLIDHNGDQCLDFVSHMTSYSEHSAYEVYTGNCDGSFERAYHFYVSSEEDDGSSHWNGEVYVADFNGDGFEDILGAGAILWDQGQYDTSRFFEADGKGSYVLKPFPQEYAYKLPPSAFLDYCMNRC